MSAGVGMDPESVVVERSYRLHDKLGQGGMGSVYRATELLTGKVVALKLLRSMSVDPASPSPTDRDHYRLTLAREFQTLASLHHPNIIRVQSYGFDDRLGSYYTMDVLPQPLTLEAAAHGKLPSQQLQLAAQLLRALGYIHSRGVLHRDLKPGNILVIAGRHGPQLKVLDFGIAASMRGSHSLAGTPRYMAPELLQGSPATIASDLYSVGIIFYRILTGRFPSQDTGTPRKSELFPQTLLDKTRSQDQEVTQTVEQPSSPSRHPSVSGGDGPCVSLPDAPALGAWGPVVERLLSPRPEGRYQSAEEVLAALSDATSVPLRMETHETRESFLQATELVGRKEELQLLLGGLQQAKQGHGSAFLIVGESGVGKSRLVSELRTLSLVQGAWVVVGQAAPGAGSFYRMWTPLLRALPLRTEVRDEEAALLLPLVPDLEQLLGRPVSPLQHIDAHEARARTIQALLAMLGRLHKPLVLLLEDLQWAREENIELLIEILKEIRRLPVLLIATKRSEESPEFELRLGGLQKVPLRRFNPDEIALLCQQILGEAFYSEALIDYLQQQTEGNVFFIVEVMRALAESAGSLGRVERASLPAALRTAGIESLLEQRIAKVPPEYRALLDFAAAQGRTLDPKALGAAYPQHDLADFLRRSANAAVLESAGVEWRFCHDKLREQVLAGIPAERHPSLHRQVAEAIEVAYEPAEREVHSAALAYHFRAAGLLERALAYCLQAAELAVRMHIYAEGRRHLALALEILAQLPETPAHQRQRAEVIIRHAEVSIYNGVERSMERLEEARQLLGTLDESGRERESREDQLRAVRIEYLRGLNLLMRGRCVESIRCHEYVQRVAQQLRDEPLRVRSARALTQAMASQGYVKTAGVLVQEMLRQDAPFLDEEERLRIQITAAGIFAAAGDLKANRERLEQILESATRRGGMQAMISSAIMLCEVHRTAADWHALVRCAQLLAGLGSRSGELVPQCLSTGWLATAAGHLNDSAAAARWQQEYTQLLQRIGGEMMLADRFEALFAALALRAGRPEEALPRAQRQASASLSKGMVIAYGIAERVAGAALRRLDSSSAESDRHFQSSIDILRETQNVLDAAQSRLAWALACSERGERTAAKRHMEEACQQFQIYGCHAALQDARAAAEGGPPPQHAATE